MWSLPDIKQLNEEAVRNAPKLDKAVETGYLDGEKVKCDWCEKEAKYIYPWHDIFSDDPKGIIGLCEEHNNYYGNPSEGYFRCDSCGKVFIENYTWELYYHCDVETSGFSCLSCHFDRETEKPKICLNCYFDREIEKPENWITSVKETTYKKVTNSKHLIPVSSDHWKNHLKFVGNVEFDNLTGEKITGISSTSSWEDGLEELRDLVKETLKNHKKCILILDGAYQFAVSIGVYVRK